MRDRLASALAKASADYVEVRFETEDTTSVAYRGPEPEQVASARLSGGMVRACVRGGWGLAVFDSLDGLEYQVAEACRCAELVGKEKTDLADTGAPVVAETAASMRRDFRGVSLDTKIAMVAAYNDLLLTSAPGIETSYAAYGEEFRTVHFASSRGAYVMEERPKVTLMLLAVARDGSLVQQSYDGLSTAVDFDEVTNRESMAEDLAKRTVALLKAPPCDGGPHTVVLDNRLAGVFAHEAFGHLSEADFIYENPKMRDLMVLGRPMGVQDLNIIDDGTCADMVGTHPYDDEGTPTRQTYLIRDGVLSGHLHSLETAAKMGAAPTGNARAIRRNVPPIVRMTNTYIDNGDRTVDDLFAGIDKGVYACDAVGGQTMMEMFTFSAGHGYRIENGQKGEMVRDVVLTGNVFETLHNIDGIANDLQMIQGAGGCGKGGQFPLPVSFGAPHIRIRNVVIGGK